MPIGKDVGDSFVQTLDAVLDELMPGKSRPAAKGRRGRRKVGDDDESDEENEPTQKTTVRAPFEDMKKYFDEARALLPQPYRQLEERICTEAVPEIVEDLMAGFNALLHGVGAKARIVKTIVDEHLAAQQINHVHVKAYEESTTLVRELISSIAKYYDVRPPKGLTAVEDVALFIAQRAQGREGKRRSMLVVVIEGLDAPVLREKTAQEALSQLCAIEGFRLIATVHFERFGCRLFFNAFKCLSVVFLSTFIAPR